MAPLDNLENPQVALKKMAGADLKTGEAQDVMARLDLNGDGLIDYEEFKQSWAFTTVCIRQRTPPLLWDAFKKFVRKDLFNGHVACFAYSDSL